MKLPLKALSNSYSHLIAEIAFVFIWQGQDF